MELELSQTPGFRINCAVDDISDQPNPTHCPKSNQHFLDISGNVEESLILQDIFRVVSRFPRYISCYIAENRLPLGQCKESTVWFSQKFDSLQSFNHENEAIYYSTIYTAKKCKEILRAFPSI